jgi:VanZ family protein
MERNHPFKKLWAFIPMLFLMSVIFYFSSKSMPKTAMWIPDYVLHFACYAVLCLFSYYGFSKNFQLSELWIIIIALILTTFYGISDEYHQSYVPGRDPSTRDVLADFMGAISVCYLLLIRFRRSSNQGFEKSRGQL